MLDLPATWVFEVGSISARSVYTGRIGSTSMDSSTYLVVIYILLFSSETGDVEVELETGTSLQHCSIIYLVWLSTGVIDDAAQAVY